MVEVSVEEGRRRESFGTGWLVMGGMTERARRSFLNQRGECFAIYPHERREKLGILAGEAGELCCSGQNI